MDKSFKIFGSLPSEITFRHLEPHNLKSAVNAIKAQSNLHCLAENDQQRPSGELKFRGGLSINVPLSRAANQDKS